MSSIDSLLNHEPAAAADQQRRESRSSNSHQEHHDPKANPYEAVDALAALATLGSGQPYAPTRELPSPTAFSHAPRRTSSFSSHAAPIEPSPPIEQAQAHSPTLDQYHHGSKSPEQQRRQSLFNRSSSPATVLAPIQNLSSVLNERVHEEPPQMATPYGKDVSQVLSPPSRSSNDVESSRDDTQNREPAFVRDEPTTTQIREPESMNDTPHPVSASIVSPPQDGEAQLPSPMPVIKSEPAGTPREATPSATVVPSSERHQSITTDSVDVETRKAIEALKQNDLGLRVKRNPSVSESVTSPDPKPAPAPSKKRPAPAPSAVKKKGTAAPKKPAPKRRKLDTDTDTAPRSSTPTSKSKPKSGKKGSQAGTPAGSSPAPDNASQVDASDDEAESSDDNALYCICRKPDNHKWMIGCDGGCDDWFHGSCVDMAQADEDLVDKFICPNCETNGRGQTTWKAMCRREGCRKPARLSKGRESKYCTDECGTLFMQDQLLRTAGAKKTHKKSRRKQGKDGGGSEDHTAGGGNATDEDEEPTPLGGVLRSKDLKALVLASHNIEDFKRLGSGVLSPPQTASPSRTTFDNKPPTTNGTTDETSGNISPIPTPEFPFTPTEIARLKALHTEKTDLQTKLEALKDREKFVSMVREQATRLAEKEKIKPKEFCGYDSRLSWSDSEFLVWRRGRVGTVVFNLGTLNVTAEQLADGDGDAAMSNGDVGTAPVVCTKKRCPKHPQWQKLNLQDARFEEVEAVEAIKECEKEERSVRERARRRGQKDAVAADLTGGDVGGGVKVERNRDGWVENVAPAPAASAAAAVVS